jgi:hypothetical protein
MRRGWIRPVLALLLVAAGIVAARALGLGPDPPRNVARLRQWIEGYGVLAPAVYVVGYVLATVFFVPGLPITVLGGVAFGPLWGTLYVWIGATIGAGLAFLVARHAVRRTVERWVQGSPRIARMDGQVAGHGWRIVADALVPSSRSTFRTMPTASRIGWPYRSPRHLHLPARIPFAGGASVRAATSSGRSCSPAIAGVAGFIR